MRALLVALLLASGCGSGNGSASGSSGTSTAGSGGPTAPVPGDASAPAATASSSTSASDTSSASSSSSAPATPEKGFSALHARFPDEPAWPSGPGTVCGAATCKKGDLCCLDGEHSRCLPKGQEKECWKTGEVAFCDESSDCSADNRCCQGYTEEGMLTTCASKARCATFWDRPGGRMIPAVEICARGGTCKTTGTVCVAAQATSVSGGQCVSAKARVRCGSKADCPADKPWCLWDGERKTGECIPRGPWRREEGVIECDQHSDCPEAMCCSGNTQTFCSSAECDPGLAYAAIVCRTDKDCGKNEGNIPSCSPDERLPDGLGTCGWMSPGAR